MSCDKHPFIPERRYEEAALLFISPPVLREQETGLSSPQFLFFLFFSMNEMGFMVDR